MRRIWSFEGFVMRVFKWSYEFTVDAESSIVPVWISFPLLPLHFYSKEALFSIAQLIGTPLKLDASTSAFTRPSVARVCVELALNRDRILEVYIVNADIGFWQRVVYEDLPNFCTKCSKVEHCKAKCRSFDAPAKPMTRPLPKLEYRPKQAVVVSDKLDAGKFDALVVQGSIAAAAGVDVQPSSSAAGASAVKEARRFAANLGVVSTQVSAAGPDAVAVCDAATAQPASPLLSANTGVLPVDDAGTDTVTQTGQLDGAESYLAAVDFVDVSSIADAIRHD